MRFFGKAGNLFAMGLIVFFFFPWVKLWILQGSAYDIAVTIGKETTMLWMIPLLGAAVIILGTIDKNFGLYRIVSIFAGVSPIVAIIWGTSQIGYFDELGLDLFDVFSFGAYASIAVGVGLILSALNIIKMPIILQNHKK